MSSKGLKKATLKPGFVQQSVIDFYTSLLRKHNQITASTPACLVDERSLASYGIAVKEQWPAPPRFVVLVDKREKGHTQSSEIVGCTGLCATLLRMGIWAVPWTLPAKQGDYAIVEYTGEADCDSDDTPIAVSSSSSSGTKRKLDTAGCGTPKRSKSDDDDDDEDDGNFPPGYKLQCVIERKTARDLRDSIYKNHRQSQRDGMFRSGAPILVWMITEYIESVGDSSLKQLFSAVCHETFTSQGLATGQKTCCLQLRSDASVPEALGSAVRWIAEDSLKEKRCSGALKPVMLNEFFSRHKKNEATAAQLYAATLASMVPGLGEARAMALQREYPTWLHLSKDCIFAANNPAKRDALVQRLADVRCGAVLLTTDSDHSRRIGNKLAEKIVAQLVDPYEELARGVILDGRDRAPLNPKEVIIEDDDCSLVSVDDDDADG